MGGGLQRQRLSEPEFGVADLSKYMTALEMNPSQLQPPQPLQQHQQQQSFQPQPPPQKPSWVDRPYMDPTSGMVDQNQVDLMRLSQGVEKRQTVMFKNLPNKLTQKMLLELLDETHHGEYDFVYLRMDFKNRCNVGYAFINFIDPKSIVSFALRVCGKKWKQFNSDKVCTVCFANIQGKDALINKFKNSAVMDCEESFRPKIFYSSGPLKGQEEPFPLGHHAHRRKKESVHLY